MLQTIVDNLSRQHKALNVLANLLTEEFDNLRSGKPKTVAGLQMSIQELIRQIAAERMDLKAMVRAVSPDSQRLDQFAGQLPEEDRGQLDEVMKLIDAVEQKCAMQSAKNRKIAKALWDQSKKLLDFMHGKVNPDNTDFYTAKGQFSRGRSGSVLVRGAL